MKLWPFARRRGVAVTVSKEPPDYLRGRVGTLHDIQRGRLIESGLKAIDEDVPPWVTQLAAGQVVGEATPTPVPAATGAAAAAPEWGEGGRLPAELMQAAESARRQAQRAGAEVTELARSQAQQAGRDETVPSVRGRLTVGNAHVQDVDLRGHDLRERRQEEESPYRDDFGTAAMDLSPSYGTDEPAPGFAHAARLIAGAAAAMPEIAVFVGRWLERPDDDRVIEGLKNELFHQSFAGNDLNGMILLLDQAQSEPRTRDWLMDALARELTGRVLLHGQARAVDVRDAPAGEAMPAAEEQESRSRRG